jgi:uncharacterized protein (TIGR03435 family)
VPAWRTGEPTFDVVSVKPSRAGEPGGSINVGPGGRFVVVNNTVRNIIRTAYQVQDVRFVGGPAWSARSPLTSSRKRRSRM